jgi:hypothetical protein
MLTSYSFCNETNIFLKLKQQSQAVIPNRFSEVPLTGFHNFLWATNSLATLLLSRVTVNALAFKA